MTKLYRSRKDRKLLGLCGGLAEVLRVDATFLRIVVVVTAFFSWGTVIFLYLLVSMVIPKEPDPLFAQTGPSMMHTQNAHVHHETNGFGTYANRMDGANGSTTTDSHLDAVMRDLETKAMRKEIEELKAKLKQYEKGDV